MIYISEISTEAPKKGRNKTEDKVYALFAKLKIPFEKPFGWRIWIKGLSNLLF